MENSNVQTGDKTKHSYCCLKTSSLDKTASYQIKQFLFATLQENKHVFNGHAILCIGSDRATGDALGPLVGKYIKSYCDPPPLMWGCLDNPVHAVNLVDHLEYISKHHPGVFVIAVDASLGKSSDVGTIEAGTGAIKPGKGVNKELPWTGNAYVRGIVNVGGFMEHMVLQSTRLSLVMRMSRIISLGITGALNLYYRNYRPATIVHNF